MFRCDSGAALRVGRAPLFVAASDLALVVASAVTAADAGDAVCSVGGLGRARHGQPAQLLDPGLRHEPVQVPARHQEQEPGHAGARLQVGDRDGRRLRHHGPGAGAVRLRHHLPGGAGPRRRQPQRPLDPAQRQRRVDDRARLPARAPGQRRLRLLPGPVAQQRHRRGQEVRLRRRLHRQRPRRHHRLVGRRPPDPLPQRRRLGNRDEGLHGRQRAQDEGTGPVRALQHLQARPQQRLRRHRLVEVDRPLRQRHARRVLGAGLERHPLRHQPLLLDRPLPQLAHPRRRRPAQQRRLLRRHEGNRHQHGPGKMQYGRASFYLVWNGKGGGFLWQINDGSDPWNPGWTTDIGTPLAARYTVGVGLRRDYTAGTALVNPNPFSSQTYNLGASYITPSGSTVTTVTLPPITAMVLKKTTATTTPTPTPTAAAPTRHPRRPRRPRTAQTARTTTATARPTTRPTPAASRRPTPTKRTHRRPRRPRHRRHPPPPPAHAPTAPTTTATARPTTRPTPAASRRPTPTKRTHHHRPPTPATAAPASAPTARTTTATARPTTRPTPAVAVDRHRRNERAAATPATPAAPAPAPAPPPPPLHLRRARGTSSWSARRAASASPPRAPRPRTERP